MVGREAVSFTFMTLLISLIQSHCSASFLLRTRGATRHSLLQSYTSTFLRMSSSSSSSSARLTGKVVVPLEDCLAVHGQSDVVFIDGSWFLMNRNARTEFESGPRIAGAKYFDIDDVASKGAEKNPKGLPHMLPSKQLFAAAMDAMSITNDQHLIVYGSKGCMFVHRTWYQLKAMGHAPELVHLMGSSLQDWIDQGGPIDTEPTTVFRADELDLMQETKYVAKDAYNIVDFDAVLKIADDATVASSTSDSLLVDARDPQRFHGWADEIRPGLKRGHVPGSKNVFFLNLLDPQTLQLKPVDELKSIIEAAGVDIDTDQRLVATCGSGVTACTIIAALELCGRDPTKTWLYDGSWTEYGANSLDVPIATDPEEAKVAT